MYCYVNIKRGLARAAALVDIAVRAPPLFLLMILLQLYEYMNMKRDVDYIPGHGGKESNNGGEGSGEEEEQEGGWMEGQEEKSG